MAALLTATSAGAGASAGLVLGAVAGLLRIPAPGPVSVTLVIGVAVAADLAVLVRGGPDPVSVRRQVPQAWGRLLSPPVAASLYGARLGIGPLTVLNSWLWWAAALLGAALGVVPSVLVGLAFGLVRGLTTAAAARVVEGAMAAGMARLRAMERTVARVGLGVALVAAVASLLA